MGTLLGFPLKYLKFNVNVRILYCFMVFEAVFKR